jgi:hypothetical protein
MITNIRHRIHHVLQRLIQFSVGIVCAAGMTMAFAQLPSATTVTSSVNPSAAGQNVSINATPRSGVIATTFSASVGRAAGTSLYYRYDLIDTKFRTSALASAFRNQTTPAAFSNVVVAQGGAVGQSYIVFQVTAGVGGVIGTNVLRFDVPADAPLATSAIGFSVHESASSSFGDTPANTALLFRADNALASSFAPPFTLTGTVIFRNGGAPITGCNPAPLISSVAQCPTIFANAGLFNITADYSGDINYLPSTGTLSPQQTVSLDISPLVLPSAKVAVAYSTTLTGVGANGPTTFSYVSGDLPDGVTLAPDGTLSGTPKVAGAFEFTLRTVDGFGNTGTKKLSLGISKGDQTITFATPATATIDQTVPLNGTASSGLLVIYSVNSPSVCNTTGAAIRFISTGLCSITPLQSGDANWFAAPTTTVSITVLAPAGVQPLRLRSANGVSQLASLVSNQLQFTSLPDPGAGFRSLGILDFDGNKNPVFAFLNTTQGDLGEVSVWPGFSPTNARVLRSVRTLWRVDAVGDLDGDGFADFVWRFTGQTPNFDDTGVSFVWFSNGTNVSQVRKRGGAPLSWQLLGAVDLNADKAADMLYISPNNEIRALMATAARSCANLAAGNIPQGFIALKAASFTRFNNGQVLIHNTTTGDVRVITLDATGLTLPPSTSDPNDITAPCTPSSLVVRSSTTSLPSIDPTWRFFATADFNGDGIADIIWVLPDRTLTIWLSAGDNQPYTVINNAGTAPNGFLPILQ